MYLFQKAGYIYNIFNYNQKVIHLKCYKYYFLSYSTPGSDVMAYDWNPVTGTRGNLLVPLSIVIVTSRKDFNFSGKDT